MDPDDVSAKGGWLDKLVIKEDNKFVRVWLVLIGILSIVSVIRCSYVASFGFPSSTGVY